MPLALTQCLLSVLPANSHLLPLCYVITGEINTLQGNLNWIASRQAELSHPVWAGREAQLMPLCNAAESDSANLDHVAELLVRTGGHTSA
jgi:glutamate synthase domain-containing protein 1